VTSQPRYVVIYKDHKDARILYFGVFTSVTAAEGFMGALPQPLEGGSKTFKSLQPYMFDDATAAAKAIIGSRDRDAELRSVIREIVRHH
jgi:hypothetical protein